MAERFLAEFGTASFQNLVQVEPPPPPWRVPPANPVEPSETQRRLAEDEETLKRLQMDEFHEQDEEDERMQRLADLEQNEEDERLQRLADLAEQNDEDERLQRLADLAERAYYLAQPGENTDSAATQQWTWDTQPAATQQWTDYTQPAEDTQPAATPAVAEAASSSTDRPLSPQEEEERARAHGLELYRAAEASMHGVATDMGIYNLAERQLAAEHSTRWQDRGPRSVDAPMTWRGQVWRPNTGRYANRGGNPARNQMFAELAARKRSKQNSVAGQNGKGKVIEEKGKGKTVLSSGRGTVIEWQEWPWDEQNQGKGKTATQGQWQNYPA
jgi:hypothetical protein